VAQKPPPGALLRRQLLARLTLLVGLFCSFSQLTGALHWVVVQHERCAEHGDWVHAGEGHHSNPQAPAAPAPLSITSADLEAHGHDHCQFLFEQRELTLPSRVTASLQAPAREARAHDERAPEGAVRASLYELAPKTSPPC
jgi:hypothetical protein